jgi:hypothetical protein
MAYKERQNLETYKIKGVTMNEITIPINRNTIKLIQQYAQTLEDSEQQAILKILQVADIDLAIAEKETELAVLETEAQLLKKDKEK